MKKAVAMLLALGMLLSAASALADGIRIGIVTLDRTESGYREANVNDLQITFTEENGYVPEFVTAVTHEEQTAAVERFMEEDMPYILISAADTDGWDETLRKAKEKGIRVFLYDRMIDCDPELYTAAVVSDMRAEGETAVAWLEDQGLGKYEILHIQGQMGSAAQRGRSGPLQEKCEADESWTIVAEGSGGDKWDPDEAYRITREALDAGKTFNVVYAENNGMAAGAVRALDEKGISHGPGGDVIIMGFDCDRWALENLLNGRWNYVGQCSPFQGGLIDGMIRTLEAGGELMGLNGQKQLINYETFFEAGTITQEMIDRFGT